MNGTNEQQQGTMKCFHSGSIKLNGVFAAVDATVHPEVSGKFGVKGFPTLKLFHPNREVPKPPVEAKWSDEPSSVNHLTGDTFSSFITENKNVLTMFYAPWCGHCKKAKPHFTAAAEKLKDNADSRLAAVDCTEVKDICQKYGVSGYPTFKLFQNGELGEPFTGGRDEAGFVNFMSTLSPSSSSRQAGDL
ncbi:putative protein disulfide-isomerase A5 [Apostichopus japonicus]|uniref:Thioredoxin domain-containing protein n=1 Tax=Stichopus japonicus TaxID=307972 RepID=A0A2G8KFV2_STIJA|nr:putative protein disulfide-isomerase A5 [Apostichopus japonicus]